MPDPSHPLTETEKLVFGIDARRHAVLGFPLERGSGCNPPDVQAAYYIQDIERAEGKEAADALRAKLHTAANPLRVVKEPPPNVRPLS
jgi:hypothetical protein